MGRAAGANTMWATMGFLVTAVGLPIIGVIASALSRSSSVLEMAGRVGRRFAVVFTCVLYLTIGPLFVIPRTATVSYEVGVRPLVSDGAAVISLALFSIVFLGLNLYFGLRPGRLIDWVGRYLTPAFLILLSGMLLASVVSPMTDGPLPAPKKNYADHAFLTGLIDGYGTMDALGSLAFAVLIIDNLRRLKIERPGQIAVETAKSGISVAVVMSVLYGLLAFVGATSLAVTVGAPNGGAVLAGVSRHYFGSAGQLLIAAIVFLACLKTAIGLTTACAEMFVVIFPRSLSYDRWVIVFTGISLAIANVGLATIVKGSVPVLMFLYPLAIALILLALLTPVLGDRPSVHRFTVAFAGVAAFFDFLNTLPPPMKSSSVAKTLLSLASEFLPGFSSGMGWTVPALIGFVLGVIISRGRGEAGRPSAGPEHQPQSAPTVTAPVDPTAPAPAPADGPAAESTTSTGAVPATKGQAAPERS